MAITIDDFSKIWASTSPLTPYSFSDDNYKSGWNFIGSTPPSRQMWDFLQKNNDEKMQYLANNYLSLSGGTMTGTIKVSNGTSVMGVSDTGYVGIYNNTGGGGFLAYGTNNSSRPGYMHIVAKDSSQTTTLEARPDGTLTWGGKTVQTSATFSTVATTITYTLNSNEGAEFTADVAKTDKTILGIVGIRTFSAYVIPVQWWINGNTAHVYLRNIGTTAATNLDFVFFVLYANT